jgi:hypothetical protein
MTGFAKQIFNPMQHALSTLTPHMKLHPLCRKIRGAPIVLVVVLVLVFEIEKSTTASRTRTSTRTRTKQRAS